MVEHTSRFKGYFNRVGPALAVAATLSFAGGAHAVIARRISFGTRTDEGSRFYAAGLSVIDTCRRRGVDPWAYACSLIAAARANLTLPTIPANAAA
jgi:hypothetical protein